jgi:hypothetical protein
MKTDQAIEAVRDARREISREFDNDPARLIAHYMELQKDLHGLLLTGPEGDTPPRVLPVVCGTPRGAMIFLEDRNKSDTQ